MKVRRIQSANIIKGTKVLLRVDFNIPIDSSGKFDMYSISRLKMSLPTIQYLFKKNATIILISHLGRPKNNTKSKYRLDRVAKKLSSLLKQKVIKLDSIIGKEVEKIIKNSRPKDIIILENLRFDPREEKNDNTFAKKLAEYADIYVNDAFSNSHRKHASMHAITKFLPSYCGLLMEKEIHSLSQVIRKTKKPFTVIMGGSKISTKIFLLKKFTKIADFILLGGAMANTALASIGENIGKSIAERNISKSIKKILSSKNIYVPTDAVCANTISKSARIQIKKIHEIKPNDYIVDIGPDTLDEYKQIINKSKIIFFNGPMGICEFDSSSHGTDAIIKNIINSKSKAYIGGGDILKAVSKYHGKIRKNIFLSSGGGAMLEFLKNENLPAIIPLKI